MKNVYLLCFALLYGLSAKAQKNFPQNEFANPLQIPIQLAGSFAECRPNHFHTGIDIKTNNKENLPVLAAADGFISRISVSHSGYGYCIYMQHPNGYTTVYGHLNRFMPEVMAYVQQQQYRQQKWNVDLKPSNNQFIYRKGQQIAYSGNTGGSTAPHLHFEIRDTRTEAVYNALLFGLPVKDNIAPKATKLAFYNADQFYSQAPILYTLKNTGVKTKNTAPKTAATILPFPKVMVGIDAKDYADGSSNWLGVSTLELQMDERLVAHISLEALSFEQNRAVNAYADFRSYQTKGIWLHGLYRLPNNPLTVYHNMHRDGVLDLSDGREHRLTITLKDAYGNTRTYTHTVQYQAGPLATTCKGRFLAGQRNNYKHYTGNMYCSLPASVLYDDVCFTTIEFLQPGQYSNRFELMRPEIPAHDYFDLGIKIQKPLPGNLKDKLIFIHKIPKASLPGSNQQEAQAATWKEGYAVAKVRTFGSYSVGIDTSAPKILRLQPAQKQRIQFTVTDGQTSVSSFKGYINNQWVCFSRAGNTYTYIPDEHCPMGKSILKIIASDENDNQAVYTETFTR